MSTNDIIRRTWAQAMVQRDALGSMFYTLLFQRAPETQALFKNDMESQGVKLVNTLNFIVDYLDDTDQLLPVARDLAVRHTSYGVLPEHYEIVGGCLIEALASILGPSFDSAALRAWSETYQGLVAHMVSEAYPA